ncbi:MAG: hypothetical protein M1376_17315 [Planctomycetes bacterium]|nr:hypothetical protein [Planctomycetota bacterium]
MRTIVVVCVITAFAFIGPPAWAELVHDPYSGHDQYQTNYGFSYGVGELTKMAQTFKAGQTGILDHIDIGNLTGVGFSPAFKPVVQIWGTTGNQPDSTKPLASVTLSNPLPIDNWTLCIEPLDSQGRKISVATDTMYSIVLWASDESSQAGTVSVGATPDSTLYTRGDLWRMYDDGTWHPASDLLVPPSPGVRLYDMQFQTYVVPVPLPAGVLLGLCAVSVAGWHLRRQRA